jgi:antitoxin MazE
MYIQREESIMQVCKWGNSLAVRLPASVVKALDLREGDDIELFVEHERSFEVRKKADQESLLARLREFRGKLPSDFKFDREDAHARE